MARRDDSLALAYSTSDAYEHFHENRALIARVVEELHEHVDVDEQRFAVITERLYALLDTNRTAPAVMRMMSQADAVRIAAEHVHAAGPDRPVDPAGPVDRAGRGRLGTASGLASRLAEPPEGGQRHVGQAAARVCFAAVPVLRWRSERHHNEVAKSL